MRIKEVTHGHLIIMLFGTLMLVLIVHMWLACHSLMDWLDKGSMCGHLQVHVMKHLETLIITHYYLNTPVPVLTLHSPGPMKFPLMLVTVTSVTLVLIVLIVVITTRSTWTTLSGKVRAVVGLASAAGLIILHGFVSN